MSKEQRSIAKAWEVTIRKTKAAAKKRANSLFFTTMSVAHVDDNDAGGGGGGGGGGGEVYSGERVCSDGGYYTGQWVDKLPHGQGKYLWNDGCMYLGEWNGGKMNGKGKFSWPCGATYEGDFKSGFMDGNGVFIDSFGGSFRGFWVMNLRNGHGVNSYANGDVYEGEWRKGLQDGNGRYEWKNGNEYTGEWRNGMMCGNGSMIWSNGNKYEGIWEDGSPKGKGTFRWEDGSLYVGDWSKNPDEQSGSFYPSSSSNGSIDWNPMEVFDSVLNDCMICPVEKVTILPSQKMFNWGEGESVQKNSSGLKNLKGTKVMSRRPRRMSAEGKVSNHSMESEQDKAGVSSHGEVVSDTRGRPPRLKVHTTKKQGVTICKGHKNYDLMLNLQLGIRHSVGNVGKHTSDISFDLKSSAFDPKEKVWTKFPPEGSKHTPPHQSCEFKWKDYCPLVFRTLRKLFKVDPADYMLSICGNEALRELSSPGKSGSFFYLTNDDRYMIKTIKKAEAKVLLRMLPAYYKHVRAFENTLVTKFYGLHSVKLTGPAQKKVRFVIMGNLFSSEYAIHRRFDLKGSSQGRQTDKPDSEIDATTTLKDLDLNYIFRLQKVWFQEFCRQVDRDCDLLEQERIMDYSLLVGLHFREASCKDSVTPPSSAGNGHSDSEPTSPQTSKVDGDPTRWASITLGINMPARVEKTVRKNQFELIGEATGELYEVVLFFGIIDILQDYDISKKLEHAYKSFQYDATSISAVDPKQYSKRFRDFIFKIFVDDT